MIDKNELKKSIDRICDETGFQLYDWKLKRRKNAHNLVVYITKPGGVSLEDCGVFSRKLGDELDMNDIIETRYYLEVSSPGLERPLYTLEHFQSAVGEFLKVTFLKDGKMSETIRGKLSDVNGQMITLVSEDGEDRLINISAIQKAKTVFVWSSASSSKKKKK
ncbi:MAG: ribosome maturation factor RimP [Candidatus Cloacimonetes bacterium]|nr:ribosome maturation factor RimP [Candidatus Cloacimonadota bacterium]